MTIGMPADWTALDALGTFPSILRAREQTAAVLRNLEGATLQLPADSAWVVYGSVARSEWTSGSDIDWTMLLDGLVKSSDVDVAHDIERCLQERKYANPNPAGVFGSLCFSPELVHKVGGEHDTNRNTTQRILLLLESTAISGTAVRERVVSALLERYLEDDDSYVSEKTGLPRFLLNDIVRYWRTMAVDFSAKQRARNGAGWAIRNLKLRMSRKLIFTAGLLVCLNAHIDLAPGTPKMERLDYLKREFDKPPLQILAEATRKYGMKETSARDLIAQYDEFLCMLDDQDARRQLSNLTQKAAASDLVFLRCRLLGNEFQNRLTELFTGDNDKRLKEAFIRYGVF